MFCWHLMASPLPYEPFGTILCKVFKCVSLDKSREPAIYGFVAETTTEWFPNTRTRAHTGTHINSFIVYVPRRSNSIIRLLQRKRAPEVEGREKFSHLMRAASQRASSFDHRLAHFSLSLDFPKQKKDLLAANHLDRNGFDYCCQH